MTWCPTVKRMAVGEVPYVVVERVVSAEIELKFAIRHGESTDYHGR